MIHENKEMMAINGRVKILALDDLYLSLAYISTFPSCTGSYVSNFDTLGPLPDKGCVISILTCSTCLVESNLVDGSSLLFTFPVANPFDEGEETLPSLSLILPFLLPLPFPSFCFAEQTELEKGLELKFC